MSCFQPRRRNGSPHRRAATVTATSGCMMWPSSRWARLGPGLCPIESRCSSTSLRRPLTNPILSRWAPAPRLRAVNQVHFCHFNNKINAGVGQGGGLGAAGAAAAHHRHPHLPGRQVRKLLAENLAPKLARQSLQLGSHALQTLQVSSCPCGACAPEGSCCCRPRRYPRRRARAARRTCRQLPHLELHRPPGALPFLPFAGSCSSPTGCAATLPR